MDGLLLEPKEDNMKKYILILIAILFPLTCLAGSIQDMHKAVIARKTVAAAEQQSYIVTETFDASGYDNSECGASPCWTEILGDAVEDASVADDDGTYCLNITGAVDENKFFYTTTGETFISFKFMWDTNLTAPRTGISIKNVGATTLCTFTITTNDTWTASADGGSTSAETSETHAENSWKYLQLRHKPGGGGTTECGISVWTGAAWGTEVSVSNGTRDSDQENIYFQMGESGAEWYIDTIKIDNEIITNPTP